MLLSAYCTGYLLEKINLPRITGYIFAGLFYGPHLLKFYNENQIQNLNFINSLALAFIAFCAGGELEINRLKSKMKSILTLLGGVTVIVFSGVTLAMFLLSEFIPFMTLYDTATRLAISSIFGVIAVARSPSSTIAIIRETNAKGPLTEIVLSVTIVTDVLIIIIFAVVMSLCQVAITSGTFIDISFILELTFEIIIAFATGFLLGKGIIFLIEKINIEFPVVIIAMGFLVIKFCHLIGEYFYQSHDISINIEPLLICMASGFTIQNYSSYGKNFLKRMDRISTPIYVGFFAITGASINLDLLRQSWFLGLTIVLIRIIMIYVGSFLSGKVADDSPAIYNNSWLGFITQAGVSLGLLAEVVRRFPEIGIPIQSILVAAITLNQIIGPVLFKFSLNRVGETGK